MNYWQAVLQEYMHRHDAHYEFKFTNLGESRHLLSKHYDDKVEPIQLPKQSILLGNKFPGVKFTYRESQSMYLMACGHTMVELAKILGLSVRTIEFYVKNMKQKVGVRTKKELLKSVAESDFMENYCREIGD